LAPFPALATAAAATRSLRVGTYVIANDLRNPVLLAKDAATLDVLSGGRFELGIGVGRPGAQADNSAMGLPFDTGGVRVSRLAESLAIIRRLLAGERVSVAGAYYTLSDAMIAPRPAQAHLPILVAGSGRRLLSLAAREADIIALGLPPDVSEPLVSERLEWIRSAAGDRFASLELNLHLMAVGGRIPRHLSSKLDPAAAAAFAQSKAIPVLKGETSAMCDRLAELRGRLGINYFMVSDELMDALAPVVARLAGQ
ncbi:MAG TPA: LLM class flavin-dependent oxidoreductase, partial [Bryobacteraceae bacterium]|nr:LLM class flavin-dependent oxidoreductase [Bryobacteraceae bacterium]